MDLTAALVQTLSCFQPGVEKGRAGKLLRQLANGIEKTGAVPNLHDPRVAAVLQSKAEGHKYEQCRELLGRLLDWAGCFGGWEAQVWRDAENFYEAGIGGDWNGPGPDLGFDFPVPIR